MLTHLIITRFNVRYAGSAAVSSAWLDHRFPIFRQFCYASLQGQSEQNFKWIVLFDAETPARYRAEIDRLRAWPNFAPYFLDAFDLQAVINAVHASIAPGTTHLLSTTLDNDDAVAKGFVSRLQQEVRDQSFELINLTNGVRLDVRRNKLYQVALPTNPFISLVENVTEQPPISIISCLPHSTIPLRFPTVQNIETEPLWMQVVHGKNAAPTGRFGRLRVPITQLDRFALEGDFAMMHLMKERGISIQLDRWRGNIERTVLDMLPDRWIEKVHTTYRNKGR